MLINVVKHANVQIRVKPDDDGNEVDYDIVDDYDGKDGVQYDDGKDSVQYDDGNNDLSFLQPAAKVAFLLFCSASHSSKPLLVMIIVLVMIMIF